MKKKYLKTIIILLVIAVAVFIGYRYISNSEPEKNDTDGNIVMDWDEKLSEAEAVLSSEASDIDGWSKLDKRNAGLNPDDGADTDRDGLTDKEEIEVYGSDPNLKSTAGDFYEDGYKVANGMDLFTKYDYQEEIIFEYNECEEIIFTADDILDFWASARAVTGLYKEKREVLGKGYDWVKKYNTYKEYYIYNYTGTLAVDVTDTLAENGLGLSDIIVLVGEDAWDADLGKCDYTKDGNVLTLDAEFNKDKSYVLVIADKETNNTLFNSIFNSISESPEDATPSSEGDFLYSFVTVTFLFGEEPEILYVSSGDEETDLKMLNAAVASARKVVDDGTFYQDYKINLDDCVEVTQEKLNKKRDFLRKWFPNCEFTPYERDGKSTFQQLALEYFDYASIDYLVSDGASSTPFYTDDVLPFGNFGSTVSAGGNCAGIAHLTSSVYNSGSVPLSGSYEGITWDMTLDENYETFTNRYLYDYKDRNFIADHKSEAGLVEKNLSAGEEQFINMVGAFLKEGNDRVDITKYQKTNGVSNYSFELIEDMMEYLDSGRILDWYFTLQLDSGGTAGHVVNIYDYRYSLSSRDEIHFYCYDTNYAFKSKTGGMDVTNVLVVTKKRSDYGNPVTFEYLYRPGNIWTASNAVEDTDDYLFVIMDDKWNVFNDKYE